MKNRKKMCDQYGVNPGYNWVCSHSCRKVLGIADKDCQIIPKPAKTRTVKKVKAWIADECFVIVGGSGHPKNYVPCTITYRLPRKGAK